jgi:hypothetical protein
VFNFKVTPYNENLNSVRKRIKVILIIIFLIGFAGTNSFIFSQEYLDGLKANLKLADQNRLLEAEALEFKGNSMLKAENLKNSNRGSSLKKNSKDEVIMDIEQLDALVFFAFSNELKFNVFDQSIKQFWSGYKGAKKDIDVLQKFEKSIYDSLDFVSDLRKSSDRERTITSKFMALEKAGYMENHAILQMGKLLYTYFHLPDSYNKKWLTSEDLSDPYYSNAPKLKRNTASAFFGDTSYQHRFQKALEIFNLMDITESQIEFFNEFLAIHYPLPENGVDFIKLSNCNVDSLKFQWQSYLFYGLNSSDSTVSKLLTFLSKGDATTKNPITNSSSVFLYKIQILASREKLDRMDIQKIYSGKENISENFEDTWYKYTLGNFKTYKEAKVLRDRIHVEGSFIVAYLNGKRIDVATYSRISGNKQVVHEIGVK